MSTKTEKKKELKSKSKELREYKLKTYARFLGSSKPNGMTRLYMAFNENK